MLEICAKAACESLRWDWDDEYSRTKATEIAEAVIYEIREPVKEVWDGAEPFLRNDAGNRGWWEVMLDGILGLK
jgi:hypothetical protein